MSRLETYDVLLVVIRDRGRSFHTQTDDGLTAKDHQTQRPLHLLHRTCLGLTGLLFWTDATELFTLCKDEVHVAVEGQHLTNERAAVVDRDLKPPVNEAEHFAALRFWRRLHICPVSVLNGIWNKQTETYHGGQDFCGTRQTTRGGVQTMGASCTSSVKQGQTMLKEAPISA